MRVFYIWRGADPTGKSGLGFVAEGVKFSDQSAVVRWRTARPSTVIWRDWKDGAEVHSHPGTVILWEDDFVGSDGVPILNADTGFSRADNSEWLGTGNPGKDGWVPVRRFVQKIDELASVTRQFHVALDGRLSPRAAPQMPLEAAAIDLHQRLALAQGHVSVEVGLVSGRPGLVVYSTYSTYQPADHDGWPVRCEVVGKAVPA